jgi:hypothetical protein
MGWIRWKTKIEHVVVIQKAYPVLYGLSGPASGPAHCGTWSFFSSLFGLHHLTLLNTFLDMYINVTREQAKTNDNIFSRHQFASVIWPNKVR